MWGMLICILCVFFCPSNGIKASSEKGKLVVFGDDLGDTGNLQHQQNNTDIGYSSGRMTNGPVFVEYMATQLNKQLLSAAYVNATISNKTTDERPEMIPPSLENQILNFTETERDWIRRKSGPQNSIAVVSAGTSDVIYKDVIYKDVIYKGVLKSTAKMAQKLVDRMARQIENMEKLGFGGIVIGSLPAIYVFPRYRLSAMVDGIREFVKTSNMLLRKWLVAQQKQKSGVRLWLLDIEEFMLVTANSSFAEQIGARNSTGSCITDIGGGCEDPADYVFYDDLHMDSRLHHLLGLVAADMVQGADIKYDADYLGQMARKYDIGVLHQTSATAFGEDAGLTAGSAVVATDVGDPLVTSTSSVAANSTLAPACTVGGQETPAYEQRRHVKSSQACRIGGWSKSQTLLRRVAPGLFFLSFMAGF